MKSLVLERATTHKGDATVDPESKVTVDIDPLSCHESDGWEEVSLEELEVSGLDDETSSF